MPGILRSTTVTARVNPNRCKDSGKKTSGKVAHATTGGFPFVERLKGSARENAPQLGIARSLEVFGAQTEQAITQSGSPRSTQN